MLEYISFSLALALSLTKSIIYPFSKLLQTAVMLLRIDAIVSGIKKGKKEGGGGGEEAVPPEEKE